LTLGKAIEIQDLLIRFGATQALSGLTFSVEEGDVYGFLGPNGAGKTTTIRILATLLRPDSGEAFILGNSVLREPEKVRPLIGYMPDSTGAYRDMVVREYLDFFAAAYRIPTSRREQVVGDVLSLAGLEKKAEDLIEGLSRGMRQRLGLARCLIHDPQVLILDEPASGLDPRARIEVLEVLRTLADMGKSILISSHILSELRYLCNKIGIIDQGRMLYEGTMREALTKARTALRLEVRLVQDMARARDHLVKLDGVLDARVTEAEEQAESAIVLELDESVEDYSFIAAELVQNGFKVLTIREEEILLEDAFIRLTEPEPAA
jgi:ABC-2 type transport system ATP-binding protein